MNTLSLRRLLSLLLLSCVAATVGAQQPSPHAIDIPRWFSNSLLDFQDEIPEATREGRRVMVYFGQDGCPYCQKLMTTSFGPGPVADKMRKHFTAIAVNIWGDTEATWVDGRKFTEKTLARELKVQFTPTLLFFDTDGRVALRLNGYQPPEKLEPVLDYLIARRDRQETLAQYLASRAPAPKAAASRVDARYLMRDPSQLARKPGAKPLAVLFEGPACKACDELHDEAFQRKAMQPLLARFDIARLLPGQPAQVVTPAGARIALDAWSRELGIGLLPTVVFFDARGAEVFRFEGYLRPFHIESAFDCVASGAYREQPQFQRFVQERAERLAAAGKPVDLWK